MTFTASHTAPTASYVAPVDQHFPARFADEARDWMSDCEWGNLDADDIGDLTGREALYGVINHCDGGLESFAAGTWI